MVHHRACDRRRHKLARYMDWFLYRMQLALDEYIEEMLNKECDDE